MIYAFSISLSWSANVSCLTLQSDISCRRTPSERETYASHSVWRLRRRRWQRLYPYRSNKFIIERCCWLWRGNERYVVIYQCIKCAEISDTFFVVRSSARIQDGPGYGTVEGFYKEQNDVEAISQPILGLIAHSPCFCIRIYTCELVISNRKYDLIPNFLSNIYQFYNKNN